MKIDVSMVALATIGSVALVGVAPGLASAPDSPGFQKDIAPILAERCVTCHGPEKQKGGYRLDFYAHLLKAGDSGEPPVVPGKPEASHLLQRLTTEDADDRMPQKALPLEP